MKTSRASAAVAAVIISVLAQVSEGKSCFCDLRNTGLTFPADRLQNVLNDASDCTHSITSQRMTDVDILLDQLHYRLQQLQDDVTQLEREDDGELYGAVSLRIIEIELAEVLDILARLNTTNIDHQRLRSGSSAKLQRMSEEMKALVKFDRSLVVQKQQENQRLTKELAQCQAELQVTPAPPFIPPPGNCPHGHLLNVTGPRTYTLTEYGTSYTYGAWGRDPKPPAGMEDWYWLVVLTSSSVYSNYVRQYSSHSALIVGVSAGYVTIAASNPTTNTIQGPNVVLYGGALYYGCYNSPNLCRFNMTSRTITTVTLPNAGYNSKFNFCHLDSCYGYTDIDATTDESGLWVVYSNADNYGNVVLSEVEPSSPPTLINTWRTSLHKRTITNTFMACGVLYATRYVSKEIEEIFYAFDTVTGKERYDLRLQLKKMSTNIQSLNYNPLDQMLYAFSDAYVVSYQVIFG
ncbi:olfactomedin-4-like [Megalops cyprinoides]|uniref:olfactomedin-4-like n=1 Tax=Megalops cyprinoides TaxID=118141 RepID=UPI001864AF0E|nr:olfactomedin-4-like [Megalops cyprinoides]